MSYKKLLTLIKPKINEMISTRGVILIFLLQIISVFIIQYDGENVFLLNTIVVNSGINKKEALEFVYYEYFSLSWILFSTLYLLPKLLLPLSNSFSVNQLLWLRLTPCSPIEIATTRVLWVISWAIWLSFSGIIWLLLIIYHHRIFLDNIFLDITGLASYIIFTGSIVITCTNFYNVYSFNKTLISLGSLCSNIIFCYIYYAFPNIIFKKFLPIALPFSKYFLPDRNVHFIMAALIGSFLLIIHMLRKTIIFLNLI